MARLKLFIPLIIFLVLAAFLLRGLSIDPTELPSALKDRPFPEFNLTDLAEPSRRLTLDDVKGQVALVNVWATWCISCKVEHAQLLAIAGEGVPVIGINYKDDRVAAKRWLRDLGDPYTFNIFDDGGSLGLDLGVYGAPETYVIDHLGIIRHKHVGVVTDTLWQEELGPLVARLRGDAS